MGNCIYVAHRLSPFAKEASIRVVASEDWADPAEVGARLGKDHFLNTTTGVWLYATDLLNDPDAVRAALHELADRITTPEFQRQLDEAVASSTRLGPVRR